jgi:hypothetical protein
MTERPDPRWAAHAACGDPSAGAADLGVCSTCSVAEVCLWWGVTLEGAPGPIPVILGGLERAARRRLAAAVSPTEAARRHQIETLWVLGRRDRDDELLDTDAGRAALRAAVSPTPGRHLANAALAVAVVAEGAGIDLRAEVQRRIAELQPTTTSTTCGDKEES